MKNILKKLISKNLVEALLVIFGTIAIFQWVVAPGLTTDITAVNILSAIIGFTSGLFVILYIKEVIFPSKEFTTSIKESETELDYVPKPKPKTKRKPKSIVTIDFTDAKGMNEIDSVITPIVEGRVKISVENPKQKRKL
jgi:phosphate/sulfate permease